MRVIVGGKASGKSYKIIRECEKGGGYIVCHDRRAVENLRAQARQMKANISMPITMDEFIRREYHTAGVRNFYFDNVDLCLESLSRVPIRAITVTGDAA